MYHLRASYSTPKNPRSMCGAEPEQSILGHSLQGETPLSYFEVIPEGAENPMVPTFCRSIPMLTEWEWVKSSAHGHPGICQVCVACAEAGGAVRKPGEIRPTDASEECPF